ncbi:heparan-sulfate 6-O-sulfotransferase 2-like isoform X2 [Lineus longissimus]|uniref:heparan-sulfate 6-O-sulfotransferase 2-like isoform X2 n=1 Tax=Lineus longissimus TaxID=88925 RepID=UPI00315CA300
MWERRRIRSCFAVISIAVLIGIIYIAYFCPGNICGFNSESRGDLASYSNDVNTYLKGVHPRFTFEDHELHRYHPFQIEANDVLVFLHIQKTGGTTFGKHLVKNIELDKPCQCYKGRKRCDCMNGQQNMWLFSRYSTGWRCGLHADWTELKDCVEEYLTETEGYRDRRYLYITIVRDPVDRYLSEWRNVERGATWKNAELKCNGRQATLEEVPFCFEGENWEDVKLDQFTSCPHNLANNRQTRMLSNLSLVGCYNRSAMAEDERNRIMLQSAKQNLRDMAYFGILEFQIYSQYLFEQTFRLRFIEKFVQLNVTHSSVTDITPAQKQTVINLNKLDISLYQFARDLFLQRLRTALLHDPRVKAQIHFVDVPNPAGLLLEDLLKRVDFNLLTTGKDEGTLSKTLKRKIKKQLRGKKREKFGSDFEN